MPRFVKIGDCNVNIDTIEFFGQAPGRVVVVKAGRDERIYEVSDCTEDEFKQRLVNAWDSDVIIAERGNADVSTPLP